MKLSLFLFLLFLQSEVLAQTSYVPSARVLRNKGYQLSFGGDYFTSTDRVDENGKKNSLSEGEKFTRAQGEFGASYGATDEFQLEGGIRFRQNQSTYLDNSSNLVNGSSTGVQSTWASFQYAFKPVEKFQYALEGLYRFTPYTNEEIDLNDPGNVVLGDDGNEYQLGLVLTYTSNGNNFLNFNWGYRRPGKDLSSELYWQAEGALVWRYVALVAGVDGITSLKNDAYTNDPENKPKINTGGSELYNSVNREWVAPYAGVNFALADKWRIEFKASQTVVGRSTDLGTTFGLQVIRRVDQSSSSHPDKKFKAYDIEATVTKISPKLNYLVIDKGLTDDIQKGMIFDLFDFDYLGGNILVAQGVAIQVKSDTAILKIINRYNTKKEIREGLLARSRAH